MALALSQPIATIPAGWRRTRVKQAYSVQLGKMLQNKAEGPEDTLQPYLKASNITPAGLDLDELPTMWFSPEDKDKYSLRPGDLLVSEGGDVGRAAIWDAHFPCYIQNAINRVRAREGNSTRYLFYWLSHIKASGYLDILCNKATIAHYTAEKLGETPLLLPPVSRQTEIAAFLDRETAQIDALIGQKGRLLALLEEKRRAEMRHVLTRGLNRDVPQGEEEVWGSRVPVNWKVVRLRRVGDVEQGCTFPQEYQGRVRGDLPWYKVEDMTSAGNEETMGEATNYVSHSIAASRMATIFPPGSTIFPRVGAALLTNKRRMLSCPSITDDNIYAFIPRRMDARFAFHVLTQVDMASICTPGLVPTVSVGAVKDVMVPLPPLDEQLSIVRWIEMRSAHNRDRTQRLSKSIHLLRERRQSIITAAVTGQLDPKVYMSKEGATA